MTDRQEPPKPERPSVLKLYPPAPRFPGEPAPRQHEADEDDEPLGGDPACWAHLVYDDPADQPEPPPAQ